MPDWFYRTVSRPLLFRLPARAARDFALGFMGRLSRLPLGPALIDFLGHMRAFPRLRRSFLGVSFPAPIGLGVGLDGSAAAPAALARFGIGFLEVGPVTPEPYRAAQPLERRADQEAVWYPDPPDNPGLEVFAQRLARASRLDIPVIVRLGCVPGATPAGAADDCRRVVERLAPPADLFSVALPGHATATPSGPPPAREPLPTP